MKKVSIFMMMIAIVAVSVSCRSTLGTIQQSKQARVAKREAVHNTVAANRTPEDRVKNDKEIRKVQEHLNAQLTLLSKMPDTLDRYPVVINTIDEDSAVLKYLRSKSNSSGGWNSTKGERLRTNANRLEIAHDSIIYDYVTDQEVPKEMTPREYVRRYRGTIAERRSLVTKKAKAFVGSHAGISPAGYVDYEGVLVSMFSEPVNVIFFPVDGGEKKFVTMPPKEMNQKYVIVKVRLVPGRYVIQACTSRGEIQIINPLMDVPLLTGAICITGETTSFTYNFSPY